MANRYWVGGSGTWNTTSTTNWSATSGGASGASVPTAADSVFFDQAGTYTVTMTGALNCLDFNVSAGSITFAQGTAPTLGVAGSMTITNVTPTWSMSGTVTFSATSSGPTVTTNGTVFTGVISFNTNSLYTLGSSLTTSSSGTSFNFNGTLNTAGFAVTGLGIFAMTAGTLNLSSSTVTVAGITQTGTSTINGGTSTINITAATPTLSFNGTTTTLYNVNLTSTSTSTTTIQGSATFNDLTVTAPIAIGVRSVIFGQPASASTKGNCIFNGGLKTTGTAGNRRVVFASATTGLRSYHTVNGTCDLTDADFVDMHINGTSSPISGTRIGNRGRNYGITFSPTKNVYWNNTAGNWSSNSWAATDGGAVSTDYFPLPQDTAWVTNTGLATGTAITLDAAIPHIGYLDLSLRSNAMSFTLATNYSIYGDWKASAALTAITQSGGTNFNFIGSAGRVQNITTAGVAMPTLYIDTHDGHVQLLDSYTASGTGGLYVLNGYLYTNGYSVSFNSFTVGGTTNRRGIYLANSTFTLTGNIWTGQANTTNATIDGGTSTIIATGIATSITFGSGQSYYNLTWSGPINSGTSLSLNDAVTLNNLTLNNPALNGVYSATLGANITVNNLTVNGSRLRRVFVLSNVSGTIRTIQVNSSASLADGDFRDIAITGLTASGTRVGDCGGCTGITFTTPKTVYYNSLLGTNWSDAAWATSSGGIGSITNFPLAQDTCIVDNSSGGAGTTLSIDANWNIGTLDASTRTTTLTLAKSGTIPLIYGDFKLGTGLTLTTAGANPVKFCDRGTQNFLSNGVSVPFPIEVDGGTGTLQLSDAFTCTYLTGGITLTTGTFDAASYNVTISSYASSGSLTNKTLKMGSGTWTLTGTGAVWNTTATGVTDPGTANIVLSDNTTGSRTWAGSGTKYNKITIGGTTSTSTTTFSSADAFTEIASTKTVAHSIVLNGANMHFGKWTVSGSAGNVVSVTGTASIWIMGQGVSGVDYLSFPNTTPTLNLESPGEFWAGVNSSGNLANRITYTAAPTPRTLYWVGGAGNWSSTTKWSTTSGGASGAAVPTSLDNVIFNTASGSANYTATIDVTARCNGLTVGNPSTGTLTLAGTQILSIHGNVSIGSITRTFSGTIYLAGDATSKTFSCTPTLANTIYISGMGSSWSLGAALTMTNSIIYLNYGSFSTAGFTVTNLNGFAVVAGLGPTSVNLSSSTVTFSGNPFSATNMNSGNANYGYVISAGTSTINILPYTTATAITFNTNNVSYNNVNFRLTAPSTGTKWSVVGVGSYANLTIDGSPVMASSNLAGVSFDSNQTISGTLTITPGANATRRIFLYSSVPGTARTFTAASLAAGAADTDFRDITFAGGIAGSSITRGGDCGGNSGITFPAAKTVYWNFASTGPWAATAWATTSGGVPAVNNFPLPQDTAIIDNTGSASIITLNLDYNTGSISFLSRTTNVTVQLTTTTTYPRLHGDFVLGTGVTLTGSGILSFNGRGLQTLQTAGIAISPAVYIDKASGTLQLGGGAFTGGATTHAISFYRGTFDAGTYNVTTGSFRYAASTVNDRTLNMGSGTWSFTSSGVILDLTSTTVNKGTANIVISDTSNLAKSITMVAGQSINKITFTGAGSTYTFTLSGAGTIGEIASTRTIATTITTTGNWFVGNFTASGTASATITFAGTNPTTTGTVVYTGTTPINVNYVAFNFLRLYSSNESWFIGANSTAVATLGAIIYPAPTRAAIRGQFFTLF